MGNITFVAPLAGAWIEIKKNLDDFIDGKSLPSRERGLKLGCQFSSTLLTSVAPLAGAWIEI